MAMWVSVSCSSEVTSPLLRYKYCLLKDEAWHVFGCTKLRMLSPLTTLVPNYLPSVPDVQVWWRYMSCHECWPQNAAVYENNPMSVLEYWLYVTLPA